MKYITFLIGNGFDINFGLKTKYSDFYNEYLESNKDVDKNSNIGKFCEMIASDYETWSDFESAFAQKIWGTKDDISDILSDFSVKFLEYLGKQVELCDYSDIKIADKFKNFLLNGYNSLEKTDKQTIKNKYNELHADSITLDFVTFNYTNTLEKLIELYFSHKGTDILSTYSIASGAVKAHESIGLHIHGVLGEPIIIGIDSLQQLKNEDLKNNNKIAKYCVKKEINKDIGNADIEKNFIEMINRSSIIYAYGLSFGESDRSRWEIVSKWLKADSGHKLIIFKLNTGFEKFNKAYMRKLLDAIDSVKNEYLSLFGIKQEEYEKYYSQIFIVDSSSVLNFKLIRDDIENDKDIDKNKALVMF